MRISREAILIGIAAEQIMARDGVEMLGVDPRHGLRLRRYKMHHLPELTMSGGPFDRWKVSQLPWREFMRCIYRRRQRFDRWHRIAIEREFKRRVSEDRDVLVERVYGAMRRKREFDRVKQALIHYYGRHEWWQMYGVRRLATEIDRRIDLNGRNNGLPVE